LRINVKAVMKALLILVFLTALPVVGRQWIPTELLRFLQTQSGFDLMDILNRIAVVGVVLSALVILRGHVEKASSRFLALSVVWKVFWLSMVFFLIGFGHPETLGLSVLGGNGGGTVNTVIFDLRLFAGLATLIVALMIFRSILKFREAKPVPPPKI
jgi:hypothetical protein